MRIAGIGYQGRTLSQLVEILQDACVTTVIDVRETPWSRKPGLSKGKLSEALASAGIRYVHLRAAGNPKENRRSATSVQECLERYRAHMARNSSFLGQIHDLANEEYVALLCFEAEPEACHRSIIAEELASRWGRIEFASL